MEPTLYYWHRDERGSEAELDYIIQHGSQIVPIEVKAGKTGTLKSLHLFMTTKNYNKGIRIFSGLPALEEHGKYTVLSIPFYLCGQVHRLLEC